MYPVLFNIGGLTIHTYGLMIALAILVSTILLYREAPKEGITSEKIIEVIIIASVSGLVGSRLLYVFLNWSYYSSRPMEILFTQFEGLSFYGGLIGGALALYLWEHWHKKSFLKITDLLSPYLALGYAFGRIGCFLNGCCYGKETAVPWAIPVSMHDSVMRHPVQLYAAVGALVIFILLKQLRQRRPFVGFVLISLVALYGLLRFITEFFRYGDAVWLNLTLAQLFSLGLMFGSLILMAFIFNNLSKSAGSKPDHSVNKTSPKNE